MAYCVQTADRGRIIKPDTVWDGSKEFKFTVSGQSDSNYATDPETRRFVSGWSVKLNGVSIEEKSKMQPSTKLSVTEAEAVPAVQCAQSMLFAMNVLESMDLQMQKLMLLWMDNQGAVDLFNGWSVVGRTRHTSVKWNFMRELKEKGILEARLIKSEDNGSDLFTKNLGGELFDKHTKSYVG